MTRRRQSDRPKAIFEKSWHALSLFAAGWVVRGWFMDTTFGDFIKEIDWATALPILGSFVFIVSKAYKNFKGAE